MSADKNRRMCAFVLICVLVNYYVAFIFLTATDDELFNMLRKKDEFTRKYVLTNEEKTNEIRTCREIAPGECVPNKLTYPYPEYQLSDDDIKIYFSNLNVHSTLVDITNATAVNTCGYDSSKDTFFVVHGWQNSYISDMPKEVAASLLTYKDVNVFIVDWSTIAEEDYIIAVEGVSGVGTSLGQMIAGLVANNSLQLNTTAIIGHSLGAHVSGFAGQSLNGSLNHIVGLDPALPLFESVDENSRLDASDAQFVQVIHTSAGKLGFNVSIGDVDYWPNGGAEQPGCADDTYGACAHGRSYEYFAESAATSGFLSRECDNYSDYNAGSCNSTKTSYMGEYWPDTTASGSYYLNTSDTSPYALN